MTVHVNMPLLWTIRFFLLNLLVPYSELISRGDENVEVFVDFAQSLKF